MIAYLSGEIIDLWKQSLIIKTSWGVGYEVNINDFTFSQLHLWQELGIFIYHSISEGRESLYGFLEMRERQIFTEMIKISWIGGRMGLNLLNFWYDKLLQAFQQGEKSFFESVKGIGKKLGEKILIEMKDKDFVQIYAPEKGAENQPLFSSENFPKDIYSEIKKSLVWLWYKETDVEKELKNLPVWYETLELILPYIIKKLS
jgi:holliday junction DNA helicase RuvA